MVLSAFAMSTVGGTTFWIVYNIRLLLKIFFNTFWSRWPLCKLIPVCSRLEHYSSISDIQTLAMLCCTFGSKCSPHKTAPSPSISRSTSTESSQQHTNVSHYGENQIPVKILQKKKKTMNNETVDSDPYLNNCKIQHGYFMSAIWHVIHAAWEKKLRLYQFVY